MKKVLAGDYPITQYFGENPDKYAVFGLKGHNGIDFGCPIGTDCISPMDGVATEVKSDPTGYGFYIKIENDTQGCLFGHLSVQGITEGATVVLGMVIGKSGNTGNSTGPHLHFGYFTKPRDQGNGYAGYIDPTPFLSELSPQPSELDLCRLRVAELVADGGRKQAIIEARDEEIIKLKANTLDLTTQVTTLEARLETSQNALQSEINDKVTIILSKENEIKSLNLQLQDFQDTIAQRNATITDLNNQIGVLQGKIDHWWEDFSKWEVLAMFFTKLKKDLRR